MFRAGEQGRYWYAVLGGQLEVRYHGTETKDNKVIILKPEAGTSFLLLLESAPAGSWNRTEKKLHVGRRRWNRGFFPHIYYELLVGLRGRKLLSKAKLAENSQIYSRQ